MTSKYKDYMASLSNERNAGFKALTARLRRFIAGLPYSQREMLFTSDPHPDLEDGVEVFERGVEGVMLTFPEKLSNEIPLLYLGVHAMNRFTGSREPLGFVFTDKHVYVQDSVKAIFAAEPPKKLSYQDYSPTGLSKILIDTFNWEFIESIVEEKGFDTIKTLLVDTINEVRDAIESTPGFEPVVDAAPKGKTIKERVSELGLTGIVKFADDAAQAKTKAKIEKKFGIESGETLGWFIVDTIIIVGTVYGLAVTDKAVYSKDIMEDPLRTAFTEIKRSTISLTAEKDAVLLNGEIKHQLPSSLSDSQKETLLIVLKQFL